MHTQTDTLTQIRQYLTDKSADELVDLLMDLLQQIDEATRRRFWEQLAPSGLATADLRYPSPESFLADVEMFVAAAAIGEYYDEEAAEYFGEDPVDRDYHVQRGYIDEHDIAYHIGMSKLKGLLEAVVLSPDSWRYGDDDEIIATKKLGKRRVKVVYLSLPEKIRVITVMVD